jgi:hypothetical protein
VAEFIKDNQIRVLSPFVSPDLMVEVSPECCTALTDVSRLVYSQAVLTYLGLK